MSLAWQATLFGAAAPAVDPSFAGIDRVDLDATAWVEHLPGWLTGPDDVMDTLVRTAPWQSSTRPMYDRIVAVPRLTAWYEWKGEYPADAPPIIEELRAALSRRYEVPFTSCGCNLYRDGRDSVAWHGDRHGRSRREDTMVAIVSLGEPRPLALRPRGGGESLRFPVGHGDLLVMGGSCQRTWEHCVPKSARPVGPRISVQFRTRGVR
jgi:alkylated DNA repair dioxygenase AlkB